MRVKHTIGWASGYRVSWLPYKRPFAQPQAEGRDRLDGRTYPQVAGIVTPRWGARLVGSLCALAFGCAGRTKRAGPYVISVRKCDRGVLTAVRSRLHRRPL